MPSLCQGPLHEDGHPRPGLRSLVDNGLSHRLILRLHSAFPCSVHVSALPFNQNSSELAIRRRDLDPGLTILIKDNDFYRPAEGLP